MKCSNYLFLLVVFFALTVQAQTFNRPIYPIIFVHGLVGSDETFGETMEFMRDNFEWGPIYVFDAVLNADNNEFTSNITTCDEANSNPNNGDSECDVRWIDFTFNNEDLIKLGRRTYNENIEDYSHEWADTNSRIFAINFKEERIDGASGINNLFDKSNQSAIYKQGYALSKMIDEVLDFTQTSKVILVGYSMGGLAIREYLQRVDFDSTGAPRKWWQSQEEDGHKVAKVVTIGTPHLGSNAWVDPTLMSRSGIPDGNSEAMRDLKYWFDSYIDPDFGDQEFEVFCGQGLTNEEAPGIYLFGGYEVCVTEDEWEQDNPFGNADFNCDGDEDDYNIGINSGTSYNDTLSLPDNLPYTWITSNPGYGENSINMYWEDIFGGSGDPDGNPGDGCVILERQWLYSGSTAEPVGIADTLLTNRIHIEEGSDYTTIIRGLDEPDSPDFAYDVPEVLINDPDGWVQGAITYQPYMNLTDIDFYKFATTQNGLATIYIENIPNPVFDLHIYNSTNPDSAIIEFIDLENSAAVLFDVSEGNTYFLSIISEATELSWAYPYRFRIEIIEDEVIYGCTDPEALNFCPECTDDDGSCIYPILGDVDMDGDVDIVDVVEMIDFILGNSAPNEYESWAADYNEDGALNVIDIVMCVECILFDCWDVEPSAFEMVLIPAGEFTFGQNNDILNIDYDYEIMKYEVTNAEYLSFLEAAMISGDIWIGECFDYWEDTECVNGYYAGDENWAAGEYTFYSLNQDWGYNYGFINWDGESFILNNDQYSDHPVVFVSWFGSNAFADFYGMSLPTEQEWEKAARGNTGWDYPWGDSIDGSNANYWNSGDPWDNGTTPFGFYNGQNYEGFQTTDSASPFGAYDMAGNVWEWCDSWWSETSSSRVIRGGSWNYDTYNLQSWSRYINSPFNTFSNVGFRCSRTQ